MIFMNPSRFVTAIFIVILWIKVGQQQMSPRRSLLTILVFIDYQDPILKYHVESLISNYEHEWVISALYLQTNTKLNIETIQYQPQNQIKLMERLCQNLNSTNYLFAITHFRFQSPEYLHRILTQIRVPHISISMLSNLTANSYTLHMQPSSNYLGIAMRELVDHFDWGYANNKIVFIYEKQTSLSLVNEILRMKRNLQPIVILKSLSIDLHQTVKTRSVLTELRDKAETNKKIIVAISQKSLDSFMEEAERLGLISVYHHLLLIGVDSTQLNTTHLHETGVQLNSLQILSNMPADPYRIEQGLIKDALDIIKYGLRHFLLDSENSIEPDGTPNRQECSWRKVLSSPKNIEFRQTTGDKLLSTLKTVKFMGATGMVDFESNGLRRTISLKILHLSENGMIDIGFWSSTTRLNINSIGLQQINKIQKHLQVVTREEQPYVIRKQDSNGTVYFEGYCIDMLNEIAKRLQFNYSIRLVADAAYGKEEQSGRWTGIIGELSRRTADLGIGALTITYPRERVIDFTKPFMNFGITILFRKPSKTKPNLFAFLAPLKVEVWIFIVLAYIGVSFFLFSMARFSPYEWRSPYNCKRHTEYLVNRFNLVNCFWFTIGSLMKQTIDYGPRSLATRVLIGSWWFFSLIMIASYTANLAAFLTTKRLKSPIDDMEALAKQTEIKYGALRGGSTEQFFRSSKIPLYERMWHYMSSHPDLFAESTAQAIEWVKNNNYAYLVESATNEYNVQRHCELMQVGGLIESKSYGIGTTHGSPYRDRISSEILQLQENGFLNNLYIKWWKEKNLPEKCADDVNHKKQTFTSELDLENIGGIFVMLIIGITCSLIVTSLEFYFKAKRRKMLYGESNTVKEMLTRDLQFAMCTKCTSTRPSFDQKKTRNYLNVIHESCEANHKKRNSISQCSLKTNASSERERLAVKNTNHLLEHGK